MITFEYDGKEVQAEAGETMLDCLSRHGAVIENSCRAGVCQSCVVRIVEGAPDGRAQQGLSREKKQRGVALACQQKPAEGMRVTPAESAPIVNATVRAIDFRSDEIAVVHLQAEEEISFHAGQFFHVMRPDGSYRSYSVANPPEASEIELHVRVIPEGEVSPWLTRQVGTQVRLRGPYGGCTYVFDDHERDTPLVLAGVGTGAAPLLGVLRQALAEKHRGPIHFIHGARQNKDLYLREVLPLLTSESDGITVTLSALDSDANQATRSTPVDQLLKEALSSVLPGDTQPLVYLCGDPKLVNKMKRETYLAGLNLDRILSDPFVPPSTNRA